MAVKTKPLARTRLQSATTRVADGPSLLKQRAYEELKGLIQDSTFEPGSFLSERQLALQFGMSKTPVKAALERLEAEGFVAVSPQQGIVVRDLSIHEIADLFEIRLALESFALRQIAGRLSDVDAAELRRHLAQQQRATRHKDVPGCARQDSEFHTMLCRFQGNQEFLRVMIRQREKMHRVITRVFRHNVDRLEPSYREHKAIADAVLAGNPDQAVQAFERHLHYGRQFLLSRCS